MLRGFARKLVSLSKPSTTVRFIATEKQLPSFHSKDPISLMEFNKLMEKCRMNPFSQQKFVVAVSGGPDSMALLSLMGEWTNRENLVAVTIDHGFREESSKEAETVHQWVSSMKIEHITKHIDWV